MIGVAPEADLLSVSVGFGASAPVGFSEQIADAVVWAVDNGADVINLSLTTNTLDWDESWDDAFLYAFENDVVVVVAAGNRGSGTTAVGAPATIPGVLTVAGVDPTGAASLEASTQGIVIGVSAPSEELLGVSADGRLVTWSGTSGAAPIVAGIAALVRAAHPSLDASNVINRIIATARPAAGSTRVPDPLYGYGLVDAAAAVTARRAARRREPHGQPRRSGSASIAAPTPLRRPRRRRRRSRCRRSPRRTRRRRTHPRFCRRRTPCSTGPCLCSPSPCLLSLSGSASPLLPGAFDWRAQPARRAKILSRSSLTVPKILIVGGGYAGFYTAWKLEKHLRKGEAEVTIVDPLPYMTYQPFLPEVAAGSIEARHSVVALRRHLKRTTVITAKVTGIDHAAQDGHHHAARWRAVAAGVRPHRRHRRRRLPHLPDPRHRRQRDRAEDDRGGRRDPRPPADQLRPGGPASPGPERDRLLTVVVVGGGFAGIEVFAELRSFASGLLKYYPQLTFEDTHFHLVEAMGRIMPEVSLKTSEWVLKDLAKRGAYIHLDTQVQGAIGGNIELSTGETIPSDLIIWTAGVMANPTVVRGGDLPVEERGRIATRADLRVGTEDEIVEGAWAAGDVSAVPDLSGGGVGGYCVPNAQHAVRQAKLLAKNLTAVLRGELPREYVHKNIGAVAGLGLYDGVFQSGNLALKGLVAWVAHRGYHGLAMPTWERKFRVLWGWWNNLWLGRDIVTLQAVQNPRYVFEEFAARPRPAQPKVPEAPEEAPKDRGARRSRPPRPARPGLRSGPRSPTGRGRRLKLASVRVRIPAGVPGDHVPVGGDGRRRRDAPVGRVQSPARARP